MAKYLRPRRGTKTNANGQNILLKRGEIFLEFPDIGAPATIGNQTGRIVIGDGATSYQNINYFIQDPSVYCPRFDNSTYQTSDYTYKTATSAINKMGDGSSNSTVTLPNIIGAIKEALCIFNDDINYFGPLTNYANNTTVTTSDNGLVPESGGGTTKYLRADGTWQVPPNDNTVYYFPNSTRSGLCRQFTGENTKFLRADNSWQVPPNTTYDRATTDSNGLLIKLQNDTTKYLRASGSWQVPPNNNTTYAILNTTGTFPFTGYSSTVAASQKTMHQAYQQICNTWLHSETLSKSVTLAPPSSVSPFNYSTYVNFNKTYSGWECLGIFGFNTGNQNVIYESDGSGSGNRCGIRVQNISASSVTTTVYGQALYVKKYNTT